MKEKMSQFNHEINDMKYQQYLKEVKELNALKKFLSNNKERLSKEQKQNNIKLIMHKQKEVEFLEKTFGY